MSTADDLHKDIMNLHPSDDDITLALQKDESNAAHPGYRRAFKIGHKFARHAAAELALGITEKKKVPTLEPWKYLDVSTIHITRQDNDLLEAAAADSSEWLNIRLGRRGPLSRNNPVIAYPGGRGFFVFCGYDPESWESVPKEFENAGYSKAFIDLLIASRVVGCTMIRIDGDGQQYDQFPSFDW